MPNGHSPKQPRPGQGVETTPLHLGAAWGQLAQVPDLAGSRLRPEVVIPGAGTGPGPVVQEVKGLQEVSRTGCCYCLCEVRGPLTQKGSLLSVLLPLSLSEHWLSFK